MQGGEGQGCEEGDSVGEEEVGHGDWKTGGGQVSRALQCRGLAVQSVCERELVPTADLQHVQCTQVHGCRREDRYLKLNGNSLTTAIENHLQIHYNCFLCVAHFRHWRWL